MPLPLFGDGEDSYIRGLSYHVCCCWFCYRCRCYCIQLSGVVVAAAVPHTPEGVPTDCCGGAVVSDVLMMSDGPSLSAVLFCVVLR